MIGPPVAGCLAVEGGLKLAVVVGMWSSFRSTSRHWREVQYVVGGSITHYETPSTLKFSHPNSLKGKSSLLRLAGSRW